MGWVFTRLPGGDVRLDLGAPEREVLSALPDQLAQVLRTAPEERALARLAPPAYADDPEHEDEYRRYMGEDLRSRQLAALGVMSETAGAERLSEDQAQGWLAALNSLRLVLGTQLDVGEDDAGTDEPDVPAGGPHDERGALQLYHYLSMLLDELVTALSGGLDDGPRETAGS